MKKYKLKINGNSYEVDIKEASGSTIQLEVNGSPFQVEMETEVKTTKTPTLVRYEPRPSQKIEPLSAGSSVKKVLSPLPGLIHAIKVKEGDTVKSGDTLMILEAMKMENSILAESSGTVHSIKVTQGASVLQGDLLLEIV
ncbi:acetyl-CoA carboxylase biotin carboxyl carrier protein subunit [Danxiaibacter flavus]|uniref:Acetyl-CoA carboxylase biotin carboxyl carrier protein subunit n=1 Tax=Danxiaibacter flavus TaxID=3049108 RepID=A0ABV3ZFV8_9BACT|nr:acetyl-CoA carboxylase biotin carboxyl carrier protein subunit [Chitinophagaceae bacterium DXS]